MDRWNDGNPRRSEGDERPLYETFGGVLGRALERLGVPRTEADRMVEHAFLSWYGLEPPPQDAKAWLIAAAGTRATTYLSRRGLPAGEQIAAVRRAVEHLDFQREALAALPERTREAMRLRWVERKTYPEVAAELGVTEHAAKRIVARAFAKLRRMGWEGMRP
jgi:RNA polymerase sigma factor (sigma-70 family)